MNEPVIEVKILSLRSRKCAEKDLEILRLKSLLRVSLKTMQFAQKTMLNEVGIGFIDPTVIAKLEYELGE